MLPSNGRACGGVHGRARTRACCFLAPLKLPVEPLAGSKLSFLAFHLCLTHIFSKEQSPCMRFPTLVGRCSEWFSCQGICIRVLKGFWQTPRYSHLLPPQHAGPHVPPANSAQYSPRSWPLHTCVLPVPRLQRTLP